MNYKFKIGDIVISTVGYPSILKIHTIDELNNNYLVEFCRYSGNLNDGIKLIYTDTKYFYYGKNLRLLHNCPEYLKQS